MEAGGVATGRGGDIGDDIGLIIPAFIGDGAWVGKVLRSLGWGCAAGVACIDAKSPARSSTPLVLGAPPLDEGAESSKSMRESFWADDSSAGTGFAAAT